MIISPKAVIENGWVSLPGYDSYEQWVASKFVSPNAIDFTVDKMFTINKDTPFVISERDKQMRKGGDYHPSVFSKSNGDEIDGEYWKLDGNSVYDAMSNFHVKVPENVAVNLIIRSTYNRNGIFLTSGLYDTGFDGSIGFAIHNRSGEAFIAPGTRIGQIIFSTADSEGKYAGQYNTEQGKHWRE